jgi:hypothetical protein
MEIKIRKQYISHQREEADKGKECKNYKETPHPAEETIRADAPPRVARGGPFFVFGPPRRSLTGGKGMVMFHDFRKNPVVERK